MGIVAAFLGISSVAAFVSLCFVSSQSHGKAGMAVGAAGIACFLVSLLGFVLSWASLNKDNIRPLFPTIAAIVNGLSVVFYLIICRQGLKLQKQRLMILRKFSDICYWQGKKMRQKHMLS